MLLLHIPENLDLFAAQLFSAAQQPARTSFNNSSASDSFVPPPPEDMAEALSELEKFVHAPPSLPLVVRLALIHYQFEAIHPFLDGNGRIGRLLIVLLLCSENVLSQPLLYLSDYFERHRNEYYGHLLEVSRAGNWEGWISFFLRGIAEQTRDSIARSDKLLTQWQVYRQAVQTALLFVIAGTG
jgi:Fic family protein